MSGSAHHRSNPACANCHDTIDPVGFALENFDAVGRWRDDAGDNGSVDASGALPGVGEFVGVDGLEAALLSRPELFAGQVTEALLTFALGRGVDYYDAPAIRKILREAESDEYRFTSAHTRDSRERTVSNEELEMIITKKALSRRTLLKGAQGMLALPLLDAMIPAMTALAQTPARSVRRLGFVYMPMGCDQARWTPEGAGVLGSCRRF